MKRSTTQAMYRHLPGSIFQHEEGFFAEVLAVRGSKAANLNQDVLFEEIGDQLDYWNSTESQVPLPDPRRSAREYVVIEPDEVQFDLFPLTFWCPRCRKVAEHHKVSSVVGSITNGELICSHAGCGGRLRQLRYVTSHNCGELRALFVPKCKSCNVKDHMQFFDTGSFRTATWTCSVCGWGQGTRFTPCSCGRYAGNAPTPFRQGRTARDQRVWYPQSVMLLNISNSVFNDVQRHAQRGVIATASWVGDTAQLKASLDVLGAGAQQRKSQQEWDAQEAALRASGVDDDLIDQLRAINAPVTTGAVAITAQVTDAVLDMMSHRIQVERAGLYDRSIIERTAFTEVHASATGPAKVTLDHAAATMTSLGIEDLSVTEEFPIVLASFGYTRESRHAGKADLKGYRTKDAFDGKNPVFAVPADTEALLVTFDARALLGFTTSLGSYTGPVPTDTRQAKIAAAELLASSPPNGDNSAAGQIRRLVHSASHALLRALDDGQTGFGESSLAEWTAIDSLTTAIYVASYADFTLGAFDTVIRRRVGSWLTKAADDVDVCDNDPLCSHTSSRKPHAACDRCLHLTYGCRTWNADLDRKLLRDFWHWTRSQP